MMLLVANVERDFFANLEFFLAFDVTSSAPPIAGRSET